MAYCIGNSIMREQKLIDYYRGIECLLFPVATVGIAARLINIR